MAKQVKKLDKTLEAKTATNLKTILDMELSRLQGDADLDMLLFVGVDGRIFASLIPTDLNITQFRILNLVKSNLESICSQLKNENLLSAFQEYKEGAVTISGVGDNAFTVGMVARTVTTDARALILSKVSRSSVVLKHLFDQKPITDEALAGYPDEIKAILKGHSRQLFVESFDQTRGYKKNMKIKNWLETKLASIVGVGNVDEVMTVTFNELGSSAPYMTDHDWIKFLETVVNSHIRRLNGDIVADECYRSWLPELDQKLKSFV